MINYSRGDATRPLATGRWIIAHVCNNAGGWGAGFTRALSARWPEPELAYRKYGPVHALGDTLFVKVSETGTVANMIAQHGYGPAGRRYLRYDALERCLIDVAAASGPHGCSIHCPRIGCGLAGGSWESVEPILERATRGLDVFVYDMPGHMRQR